MNRLVFELTNRCNLACAHCLREKASEPSDLPLSILEKALRQGREHYGLSKAGFTGGEPFLYPRLSELFELLAEYDYVFSVVTNGLLVPRRMELLSRPEVRTRIEHISVSLEGPDPETHDAIRGEGTFKKAMQAILELKSAGIPVVVKYTIGSHNLDTLEQAALELSRLEPKCIEFAVTTPTPDNVAAGLIPAPEDYLKAAEKVSRLARDLKTPIAMNAGCHVKEAFFTCASLAMFDLYIDCKGRLGLCCMLPGMRGREEEGPEPEVAGDLAEMDLWEAHEKLLDIIARFQKDRLEKIAKGELNQTDHFQCISCARYFGKVEWLDRLPENPWSRSFQEKEAS